MLTAATLRACRGPHDLLRLLGYPVCPVPVDPEEWRRGGVTLAWNGNGSLELVTRLKRFDAFVLHGNVDEQSVSKFLLSYRDYNLLTKSVVIKSSDPGAAASGHAGTASGQGRCPVSILDLAPDGRLRRLDVDLSSPSPHALDRLNLLVRGDDEALPRIFDRALDRESVTRQFFLRFRDAVRNVGTALAQACPQEGGEAVEAEALLILSRLLFLSFVQEKGWLSEERRFLVDRLDEAIARKREFFSTVLLPLFFGCLNTPRSRRTPAARKLGRIPYLNGGLFEPSPFERRHAELQLPNELLQHVLEDVFERFDFRIEESDAAGTHVDPEMLGRVFESLMAEDERAASGSFYTPKELVDTLTTRAIEAWLGDGDAAKLERITILDPACGSGAFLLSALGVLERLWKRLAPDTPGNLRQRIVERSLFGVDIKPEAVRLCELRLWLAIVAGSNDTIETVPPLPNLDRNILQGNSLLSPISFLGHARADVYRDWVVALHAQRELVERYRTAPQEERPALNRMLRANDQRLASDLLSQSIDAAEAELQSAIVPEKDLFGRARPADDDRCRELQQRIAENRHALERVEEGQLDFFSFDVHFAPVLSAGGFDVVAGNPPWVRHSRLEPRMKRMLADRFALFRAPRGGVAIHQPDLSVAFFERALQLVHPDGVVAMLMPSKIANAAYAAPLRRELARHNVLAIEDWSSDPKRWFEADTFPMGIVCRPGSPAGATRVNFSGESFDTTITTDDEWLLAPPDVAAILRRLRDTYLDLDEVLGRRPLMGVKTGDNGAFFVEEERVDGTHLVTKEGLRIPLTALSRCVRGRDVRRWRVSQSTWMLWPPRDGWRTPPPWLTAFARRRKVAPEALQLAFVRPEHVGIKVAWKDLSRGMAAAVLPDIVDVHGHPVPLVPNQTLYSIDCTTMEDAYAIAAILNSTIADALLLCVAERAKDTHFRYFGRTVARLPFPLVGPATRDQLARLGRRAHLGSAVDVDPLVAALYGVAAEELAVLRGFVERRLYGR
ncbi:MAG TPA: N-6 DNA methylase [Thermoanaerobaculia bacterium]